METILITEWYIKFNKFEYDVLTSKREFVSIGNEIASYVL